MEIESTILKNIGDGLKRLNESRLIFTRDEPTMYTIISSAYMYLELEKPNMDILPVSGQNYLRRLRDEEQRLFNQNRYGPWGDQCIEDLSKQLYTCRAKISAITLISQPKVARVITTIGSRIQLIKNFLKVTIDEFDRLKVLPVRERIGKALDSKETQRFEPFHTIDLYINSIDAFVCRVNTCFRTDVFCLNHGGWNGTVRKLRKHCINASEYCHCMCTPALLAHLQAYDFPDITFPDDFPDITFTDDFLDITFPDDFPDISFPN